MEAAHQVDVDNGYTVEAVVIARFVHRLDCWVFGAPLWAGCSIVAVADFVAVDTLLSSLLHLFFYPNIHVFHTWRRNEAFAVTVE